MEFLLFLNPLISGPGSSTWRLLMCFESLLSLSLQEKESCVSELTEPGTRNSEAGTPVQVDVQKGLLLVILPMQASPSPTKDLSRESLKCLEDTLLEVVNNRTHVCEHSLDHAAVTISNLRGQKQQRGCIHHQPSETQGKRAATTLNFCPPDKGKALGAFHCSGSEAPQGFYSRLIGQN